MQKVKKIPMRQCIGCREKKEKKRLLRIVRTPEGDVLFDTSGRMNGRGAYICNQNICLEKALKTGALNRAFQISLKDEDIKQLKSKMEIINAEQ